MKKMGGGYEQEKCMLVAKVNLENGNKQGKKKTSKQNEEKIMPGTMMMKRPNEKRWDFKTC